MTVEQEKLLAELRGLEDQIRKGHYLNVHFRAFQLAHAAWMEHIRQNAVSGARGGHIAGQSPAGAVLDDDRGDRPAPANDLSADDMRKIQQTLDMARRGAPRDLVEVLDQLDFRGKLGRAGR